MLASKAARSGRVQRNQSATAQAHANARQYGGRPELARAFWQRVALGGSQQTSASAALKSAWLATLGNTSDRPSQARACLPRVAHLRGNGCGCQGKPLQRYALPSSGLIAAPSLAEGLPRHRRPNRTLTWLAKLAHFRGRRAKIIHGSALVVTRFVATGPAQPSAKVLLARLPYWQPTVWG